MLKNKVAVITGASSGIGEAIAVRLAKEGVKVVLGARRCDRLEQVAASIKKAGGEVLIRETDVTKAADVSALVNEGRKKYGRVDIMVNNAGIMPLSLMEKLKVEEWERTVDVNIKGVLYGIAACLPLFKSQEGGHFINVSSVGGRRVYSGCAVYCGTKFAVRAISEALRMELESKDRIRVTTIEPGAVKTELPNSISDPDQIERLANFKNAIQFLEAEDIAESVVYALSQPARVNVDEILVMPQEQGH